MTAGSALTLFVTLLVLALMPTTSTMVVSARSAAHGFSHGVMTAAGIALGDITFILIAITGLSALAMSLGSLFVLVKCIGSAYLIVLGIILLRVRPAIHSVEAGASSSLPASFMAGLMITLADQKAILFYFGLFPAFVDLSDLSIPDILVILGITVLAVGSAKLVYAAVASRAGQLMDNAGVITVLNRIGGTVMIVAGLFVVASVL